MKNNASNKTRPARLLTAWSADGIHWTTEKTHFRRMSDLREHVALRNANAESYLAHVALRKARSATGALATLATLALATLASIARLATCIVL